MRALSVKAASAPTRAARYKPRPQWQRDSHKGSGIKPRPHGHHVQATPTRAARSSRAHKGSAIQVAPARAARYKLRPHWLRDQVAPARVARTSRARIGCAIQAAPARAARSRRACMGSSILVAQATGSVMQVAHTRAARKAHPTPAASCLGLLLAAGPSLPSSACPG